MRYWPLVLMLMISNVFAEVGHVTKLVGNDSYLMRGQEKISLSQNLNLEKGDEIHSETSYIVIYLYPGTQMSLGKNSQLRITENLIEEGKGLERTTSIIDFLKGIIRLQVTKDSGQEIEQKVQTEAAVFAVRGTEFEVSLDDNKDVGLDVFEGVVEASSPLVHSFVPEYVKANEGLQFSRKNKKFVRRKFASKFKDHPGFSDRKEIKRRWKEIKAKRRASRQEKKINKKAKKVIRRNKKNK